MRSFEQPVEFNGSVRALVQQMAAAVLPFVAAVCFLLFGSVGWRLFLVSLVVVPGIVLLAFLMAWADRLTIDVTERVLRRRFRPPLPFDQVASVRCVHSLGQVQMAVKTRRGATQFLMVALDARELPRFIEALKGCCPEAEVYTSRYPVWKLIGATLAILLALYLFGAWFLQRRHPGTAADCIPISSAGGAGAAVSRRLAGVRVTLPGELDTARLAAAPAASMESLSGSAWFFLRAAGITSEYELLHYACCSRFGLVPLILKTVLVAGSADVRLYEFHKAPIAALAVVRSTGSGSSTRLFLFNRDDQTGASVVLHTSELLDESNLPHLLPRVSVHKVPAE